MFSHVKANQTPSLQSDYVGQGLNYIAQHSLKAPSLEHEKNEVKEGKDVHI